MKTAQYEPWHSDPAHLAINQWLAAWREIHPQPEPRPSIQFAAHLGREAVALQNAGWTRLDMQRTFAALGRDAICVCDLPADTDPKLIDTKEHS